MRSDNTRRLPSLHHGASYADHDAYLAQNARRNAADPDQLFSLGFGLRHWQRRFRPGQLRARLGPAPRCLIQGSASAGNVQALRAFLRGQDIPAPDIHVIDLIDLPSLGQADGGATFHHADAADLRDVFGTASFDLVLQDHLLNCAPFAAYAAVLGELRRILRPEGLVLMHYTAPTAFPAARGEAFIERLAIARSSAHLPLDRAEAAWLAGMDPAYRLVPSGTRVVMITLPLGNLEFFMPFAELEGLLAAAGLDPQERHLVPIVDSEGLPCHRHHCLVVPRT